MMKKSYSLKCTLLIFISLFISKAIFAKDIPRREDQIPALIANNVNDVVVNSQGDIWLLSNDFFVELKEKNQFIRIEATVDIQPDHIEIDHSDQIWIVSENNFQFEGYHLAYGIYKDGVLTTFLRENIIGFPNDNSSNNDDITSLLIDSAGNIWFGFKNGDVGKINHQNSQYTHYPNNLSAGESIRDMTVNTGNGDLYATIKNNMYRSISTIKELFEPPIKTPVTDKEDFKTNFKYLVSTTGLLQQLTLVKS